VKIPIDTNQFDDFIVENKLFEKTRENMIQYLKSWYQDDQEHFLEDMWTDFDTVMNTYTFENEGEQVETVTSFYLLILVFSIHLCLIFCNFLSLICYFIEIFEVLSYNYII
jgi:hypothetical protein